MSSALKPSALKNVLVRTYAAQAAAAQQTNYALPSHQPQVSTLPSGAVVASWENNSPVSQVSVIYKAGSRYETADNLGVSHLLRLCAGLGTSNMSYFGITRSLQQMGGSLSCSTDRDVCAYTLSFNRDHLTDALSILAEVSSRCAFKPWEFDVQGKRLATELALRCPTTHAVEMLHKAAYRTSGLGNSIYIPPHHVGKVSAEQVASFAHATHLSGRMAFVGLGVEHDSLLKQELGAVKGAGPSSTAQYLGGEVRQEVGGPLAYVAVAGLGAALGTPEYLPSVVAQCFLGTGPVTKYGNSGSNKLMSGGPLLGMATAININYSDSGLFGFFVVAESGSVQKAVGDAFKAVKNLKVSESDVKTAKQRAKVSLLMKYESAGNILECMGKQALFLKKYDCPKTLASAVDGVTASSVQSVINKAFSGKLSMAVYGNVSQVPYLDQL